MRPYIWRKRSNLTIVGYMWIVLKSSRHTKKLHMYAYPPEIPSESK